jgi:hypothetical protein
MQITPVARLCPDGGGSDIVLRVTPREIRDQGPVTL